MAKRKRKIFSSHSTFNIQHSTLFVPRHVAVIMDGNGRWAERRGLPRMEGHRAGKKVVDWLVQEAWKAGVKVLTVYAFSSENWQRPKEEVEGLFYLLSGTIDGELPRLQKNKVRVRFIGRREQLPPELKGKMVYAEKRTAKNKGLSLNIAVNYGARAEITDAVKAITQKAKQGKLEPSDITESALSRHLYTNGTPDPDLLIRTGGELRISNFLLWQSAYTEFWFTDVLWPDFKKKHFLEALRSFQNRQRRFGRVHQDC